MALAGFGLKVGAGLRPARLGQITITDPPKSVERIRDVEVVMEDGVKLRVDVYLPKPDGTGAQAHLARASSNPAVPVEPGRYPVIMCAHPYGKDNLPQRAGKGKYAPAFPYRVFRQPEPITFSAWTGWEAPDPGFWCDRGFTVVNADIRGFGRSEGTCSPLSESEAADYEQLIEWAGTQPWSNGRVGLLGVSYLALSQYRVAARRPAHLAAICPWEGFSDAYRDFARPGGGREDGFIVMWTRTTRRAGRVDENLRSLQRRHPLLDKRWQSKIPSLESIQVPMLVCGSFSDHLVHSRGSFEAFRRVGSRQKWLWTHRGGKWCTFYGPEALAAQHRFLEHFVAGVDTGMADVAPVRLATYRDRTRFTVTEESDFPPPDVRWTDLWLRAGERMDPRKPEAADSIDVSFVTNVHGPRGRLAFHWTVPEDVDVLGPAELTLPVSLDGADDAVLFAALRLGRDRKEVTFEGSYGFPGDSMAHGQLRVSHQDIDEELSATGWPVHRHTRRRKIAANQVLTVRMALLPQATRMSRGDNLRLEIRGRWFYPTNPVNGQFPARYEDSPDCTVTAHLSGARLLLPLRRP